MDRQGRTAREEEARGLGYAARGGAEWGAQL